MTREKKGLSISSKGFILILVPLLFQIGLLFLLAVQLQNAEAEVQRQVRSKAIISQANALSKLFYDAGVAMGGYSITKSPLFSDRYRKICEQIPIDLAELKKLVGDNPKQQAIIKRLEQITKDGLKILNEAKEAIDDNRVDVAQFRARHMYKQIRQLADHLQDELKVLTEDERRLEILSPEDQSRQRTGVKVLVLAGTLLNLCVAGALCSVILISFVCNSLLRLRRPKVQPAKSTPTPISDLQPSLSPGVLVDMPAPSPSSPPSTPPIPPPIVYTRHFALSRPALGRARDKIVKLASTQITKSRETTKKRRFISKPPATRAS